MPERQMFEKQKHIADDDELTRERAGTSSKVHSSVLKGTKERQGYPAKEMGYKPEWKDLELTDDLDEYILDLGYDDDTDEFGILETTN
ncbi:hypothetical protein NDU88_001015 [Pleurodeles waltl]|uniref:Uncharacterized protein n=1 Tax=Pleurodeles waltl TaxID=8319 RepID=A0AAV7VY76_PLEWA|nr:hypothetical protein NDU88_001015 [Pleurodeles waltl]